MPNRIVELLHEIAVMSQNTRIAELADMLGAEFAKVVLKRDARLNRLTENTTYAITDVSEQLSTDIALVRAAVNELHTKVDRNGEYNEAVAQRVHTLANHIASIEMKVHELAEAMTLVLDAIELSQPYAIELAQPPLVLPDMPSSDVPGVALADSGDRVPTIFDRTDDEQRRNV